MVAAEQQRGEGVHCALGQHNMQDDDWRGDAGRKHYCVGQGILMYPAAQVIKGRQNVATVVWSGQTQLCGCAE